MRHHAAFALCSLLLAPPLLLALSGSGVVRAEEAGKPPAPATSTPARVRAPSELRVSIVPDRPFLTLGVDEHTNLLIQIEGAAAGAFTAARAVASVGSVDLPVRDGTQNRFVARYHAPTQRFPQVVIIAVEMVAANQRAVGVVNLPLHAATEMPFRTSADAEVTLRVADHSFGPVAADPQGRVKIPIVVPPGVAEGLARAIDRDGNVKETLVDLQPAPFPRLLVLPPTQMEVGRPSPVVVFAVEPNGEPVPDSRITLRSREGQVRRVPGGRAGEARFGVVAPRLLGAGPVTLTGALLGAAAADSGSSVAVSVPLVAGRPQKLTLNPSAGWLVVGGGGTSTVTVAAEDQFGNPTSCAGVVVSVNRQPAPLALSSWGQGTIVVATPERYQGRDGITIEASQGGAYVAREIRLTGGPPTQLTLELSGTQLVADGKNGVEVRVHAVDQNGTPTLIPGLSWEINGGRLGTVRKPRVGSYVAEFIPRRARDPRDETIAVMASQALRASATFRLEPPRAKIAVTPRIGLFTNLGTMAGATASIDGVMPLSGRGAGIFVGLSLGYLHDSISAGTPSAVEAQLEIHQVPILAIARYRAVARPVEVSIGAGGGVALAYTRLSLTREDNPLTVNGTARAIALQGSAEAAFSLPPGHLVIGARYLWIDLGRTSQGDELQGNSAGFVTDLGYRLTW